LYLAAELGLPPAVEAITALPIGDPSTVSPLLRQALEGGTAFHNRDLDREERAIVESSFRKSDGTVRVLAATSTLAAGVNTPASTVVIVETTKPEPGNPPMSVGEVRNMAGRAGRFGYRESGRAIILADNAFQRSQLFARYVTAPPETVRSSFDEQDLDTWLLRLLRQVPSGIRGESAPALLMNTYGAYLRSRVNPAFAQQLQAELSRLIGQMKTQGLLIEDTDGFRLTMLGSACALSSLKLRSCLVLLEAARPYAASGTLTVESLLALAQSLPELDTTYVPLQTKGTAEARWIAAGSARIGARLVNDMARGATEKLVYWRRLKRTLLCLSWIEGLPISQIERTFTVNPYNEVRAGDIRSCADNGRYHLKSVYGVLSAAFPTSMPAAEEVDTFLLRLEFGISAAALPFIGLMPRLGREDVIALAKVGITDITALKAKTAAELTALLGRHLQRKVAIVLTLAA
jgi:replicative superfamily II helicase